jgi:hypothetical protein
MRKRLILTTAALAGLVALPAPANAGGDNFKVTICHIPPGNPENAHEISVSIFAVPAHLAHGDELGECGGGPPDPS